MLDICDEVSARSTLTVTMNEPELLLHWMLSMIPRYSLAAPLGTKYLRVTPSLVAPGSDEEDLPQLRGK